MTSYKDGNFNFPPVHALKQKTVTLMIKKEDYQTLTRQFFLGNTEIRIPLKKMSK